MKTGTITLTILSATWGLIGSGAWKIRFCTDRLYEGKCTAMEGIPKKGGSCQNFSKDMNDTISSIDLSGLHTCSLFSDPDCAGDEFGPFAQYVPDLKDFNDKASSFKCYF